MRHHIITVATHEEGYSSFFHESCKRHDITPVVLGKGVPWKGFGTKCDLIREYVSGIDDEDIILLVDCYDLVFLRPLDDLFRMFDRRAKQLDKAGQYLYTANEPATSLLKSLLTLHYGSYKDQVVNTGSYMLHARLLKSILNDSRILKLLGEASADDQKMLTQYLNDHPDVVCEFDNNRRFLLHTNLRVDIGARMKIENGVLLFRHNDATYRPFLLHCSANGPMCVILKELGYNIDNVKIESNHISRIFNSHVPNVIRSLQEKAGLLKED